MQIPVSQPCTRLLQEDLYLVIQITMVYAKQYAPAWEYVWSPKLHPEHPFAAQQTTYHSLLILKNTTRQEVMLFNLQVLSGTSESTCQVTVLGHLKWSKVPERLLRGFLVSLEIDHPYWWWHCTNQWLGASWNTEYCCPAKISDIQALENIQRNFTRKINGCQKLNYWEHLDKQKIFSLKRRLQWYSIIHIWKILNNQAPNDIKLQSY